MLYNVAFISPPLAENIGTGGWEGTAAMNPAINGSEVAGGYSQQCSRAANPAAEGSHPRYCHHQEQSTVDRHSTPDRKRPEFRSLVGFDNSQPQV